MSRDDLRGWELLCDQQPNEEALSAMQKMRGFYRTRTYRSGDLLEVEVYPVIPPKVEYSLTVTGRSLMPILVAMRDWGADFLRSKNQEPCCFMMNSDPLEHCCCEKD